MRGKGTLSLLEQSLMLLVFALATALCLKGFLAAELIAEKNAALDEAVLQARNVAEQLKYSGGEWEGEHSSGDHNVTVRHVDSGVSGLGKAEVIVTDREGTELFSIPVAWQEVDGCEE